MPVADARAGAVPVYVPSNNSGFSVSGDMSQTDAPAYVEPATAEPVAVAPVEDAASVEESGRFEGEGNATSIVEPVADVDAGWGSIGQIDPASQLHGDVSAIEGEPGELIAARDAGAAIGLSAVEGSTVEGLTVEGSTVEGLTVEGSTVEGSTVEGSSVEGSSVEDSSVEDSAVEGLSVELSADGSSLEVSLIASTVAGSAVEGSSVEGSTVEGSSAEGSSVEGSSVEGSPVEAIEPIESAMILQSADVADAPAPLTETVQSVPAQPRRTPIVVEDRTQLVAAHAQLIAAGRGAGVLGRMADLVDFEDGYAEVGRRLLGTTVVVEDLDHALRLHHQGVTDRMVTLDGDVVDDDGVVAGGSRDAQGSGVLAQKREIRDLEEITGRLEHDLSEAMTRLVTARTELKQLVKAIEGLRTQVHEGDLAIMGHEKDEVRVRHDLERIRDRLGQLGTEQLELDERLRAIALDDQGTRERRAYAEARIDELERTQLDLIAEVTSHRDRLEEMAQVLTEARIRAAQLGEKRAAAET